MKLILSLAAVLLGLDAARAHDVHRDRSHFLPRDRRASPAVLEHKGLRYAGIHNIDPNKVPCNSQSSCEIGIVDGDATIGVQLEPHSVRAKGYRLLVQGEDGELSEVPPGRENTFRGRVVGDAGSTVAASVTKYGVTMEIITSDGEKVLVEPVDAVTAGVGRRRLAEVEGDHVVYRREDVLPRPRHGVVCGATDEDEGEHYHLRNHESGDHNHHHHPFDGHESGHRHRHHLRHLHEEPKQKLGTAKRKLSMLKKAEIAIDADYEFFTRHHSDVGFAEMQITSVLHAVNIQYERDVGITHELTAIVVRTSEESDPYTSTNSKTLLNQIKDEWEVNQQDVHRDVVQLMTGKTLDGGKGGNAWRSTICTDHAYSIAMHRDIFRDATAVSAHEIGHSWSATHHWDPLYTMFGGQFSGWGANVFHPNVTIPKIIERREMDYLQDCLDDLECTAHSHCDDGVACTVDFCNTTTNQCQHTPDDSACGLFCNAMEICDVELGCRLNTTTNCDDGLACTVDSCNETTKVCDHVANDLDCDDGIFCNGAEKCDVSLGCQSGTPPDCNDRLACTLDSCNEGAGQCDHTADDSRCTSGHLCFNETGCVSLPKASLCGNGICDVGEDNGACEVESEEGCVSCPQDCNGMQGRANPLVVFAVGALAVFWTIF